jgi:cyclic pyranopterin phosphate synthase
VAEPLIDPFQRRVKDLRISITDRCNFRCTYCMPAEGMEWMERSELLTYEEQARIAGVCVERYGFQAIRVTGGEPTLRAHVGRLFTMLAPLGTDLAMTTNGVRLPELAHDLARAGLKRVNISLDSLRRDTFRELTRRDDLDRVLAGIDSALDAGLDPVKVNCVVIRGVNDDEVVDLAAFGRAKGVGIRFIEFMPLDAQGEWSIERVVPAREILDAIDAVFPLARDAAAPAPLVGAASDASSDADRPSRSAPAPLVGAASDASSDADRPSRSAPAGAHGHPEPAERFGYADGEGDVGVIASVTEPFCGDCDRIRITADGKLHNCLFALDATDLRAVLRDGGTDDDVAEAIRGNVGTKWAGHRIGQVTFVRPPRSMSQIGG